MLGMIVSRVRRVPTMLGMIVSRVRRIPTMLGMIVSRVWHVPTMLGMMSFSESGILQTKNLTSRSLSA